MKEKLTLTIEWEGDCHAKPFTKRQHTSLSQIVEGQLNRLGLESFVEKWRGKFKELLADPSDPRLTYLRRKYPGAKD